MSTGSRPPVRVAVLCESFARDGGAGAHVVASVGALRATGHAVLVVAGAHDPDAGEASVVPGLAGGERPAAASALAQLDAFGPAIVHAHDVYDEALLGHVQARWPTVASVHNHASCASGQRYLRPGDECRRVHGLGCLPAMLSGRCTHRLDPRPVVVQFRQTTRRLQAFGRVDALVAYSRFVADDLARTRTAPVHVVPYFAEPPAELTTPTGRRILFVGRVVESKGLAVLLEALADLDAELDVHGEGWALPRARATVERLGLGARVRFHGWSSAEVLADAYEAAAVVCVPSSWPEPFGIVGIEAHAHGRPVVATRTGGIPEWLDDGRSGALVPPGEPAALAAALRELLDDGERQRAYGLAGHRSVQERFSRARHLEALLATYGHVIEGRRSSAPVR